MEAWFETGLDAPYVQVIQTFGFPAKSISAEFHRPCKMGDALIIALTVADLGRSSLRLSIEVNGEDGSKRASGEVLCVCIGVAEGDILTVNVTKLFVKTAGLTQDLSGSKRTKTSLL